MDDSHLHFIQQSLTIIDCLSMKMKTRRTHKVPALIDLPVSDTSTLVPEAISGGSEERSEGEEKSPLVESVGNLISMLSPSTEIEP